MKRRKRNFSILDEAFHSENLLLLQSDKEKNVPLIYPLWLEDGSKLKKELAKQNVFCATYWPNVLEWCAQNDLEYKLANNIVCIPIDQRYSSKDIEQIIKIIRK